MVSVEPGLVGMDPERLGRISSFFTDVVDRGQLAGWSVLISRYGYIAYMDRYGMGDREAGRPIAEDTLFRIYSMSKPITSVAAMILYEQGKLELTDPVSKFIPEFEDVKVLVGGSVNQPVLASAKEPMRIWHLLTHTAGLTYGFLYSSVVDAIYRKNDFEAGVPKESDLASACSSWAKLPLLFEPGSSWNYSVATDVLGRVVEVASGLSLDRFFDTYIFDPLKMGDTGFFIDEADQDRLAGLYLFRGVDRSPEKIDSLGRAVTSRPRYLSGGAGLVSSLGDYHRFTQMLLNRGELDGVRVLGSRTVDYMSLNHLPGGADIAKFGRPISGEDNYTGIGFGLGFSVSTDPAGSKVIGSAGQYAWGGMASTTFWIDPAEQLTVIFMTQLLPSGSLPILPKLTSLVYQAIVQ